MPLPEVIAFVAVMNETIKPYLAAKGHPAEEVDKMHRPWCKSMPLQLALWVGPYMEAGKGGGEGAVRVSVSSPTTPLKTC